MANFCTQCGKKLVDGEVCDCMKAKAPASEDKTVVVNAAVQNEKMVSNSPEVNYEQRMREQQAREQQMREQQAREQQMREQQAQQNQQWQAQQNQQWQAQQNQQWQGGQQQNQQWQQQAQQKFQQWQNGQQAQWINDKKDQIVKNAKNLFAQLSPLVKKPDTTIKELAKSNNSIISLQMIGLHVIAVILMILVLGMKFSVPKELRDWGAPSSLFPTFKMILLAVLQIVAIAYLQAAMLRVFSKKMYQLPTLNQTLLVSGVGSLVNVFVILLNALLILICFPSVKGIVNGGGSLGLFKFGFWVMLAVGMFFASVIVPVFEFKAYQSVVQGDENKKVYSFILAKAVVLIANILFTWIIFSGLEDQMDSLLGNLF